MAQIQESQDEKNDDNRPSEVGVFVSAEPDSGMIRSETTAADHQRNPTNNKLRLLLDSIQ